jgi:hypothetical protein
MREIASHIKMNKYNNQINSAFINAEKLTSKISSDIIQIDGYNGEKTLHFFNNLLDMNNARLLEIGTWKGSITSAAMYGNSCDIICIDNWCQSNYVDNKADINESNSNFKANLENFKGNNNVILLENDWKKIDISSLTKRNIYFYDANYPLSDHKQSLQHFLPILDDIFIYIINDWDWSDIRKAIRKMIKDLNLEILHEKIVYDKYHEKISQGFNPTINNNDMDEKLRKEIINYNSKEHYDHIKQNWWYGICVLVLKKN